MRATGLRVPCDAAETLGVLAGPHGVMTDLTRFRAVLRGRSHATAGPAAPARAASVDLEALATELGGGLEDAPLGPCAVVRWWLGHEDDGPYGGRLRRASRAISAEGLRVLCGDRDESDAPWSGVDPTAGLLFFDLETTGLRGGAGTVAFVVGFGCFEGSRFHVWQFVLPSFAGERRLLAAVTATVLRAHTMVTFNGKSFDVPFLEMRWLYHRLATPLPALRHLDLLHPARRLWGPDTGGLGALEDRVLGFRRRGDVPGFGDPVTLFRLPPFGRPGAAPGRAFAQSSGPGLAGHPDRAGVRVGRRRAGRQRATPANVWDWGGCTSVAGVGSTLTIATSEWAGLTVRRLGRGVSHDRSSVRALTITDCWTCGPRRCIGWRRRAAVSGVTSRRHSSGKVCSTSGGRPGCSEREALRALAVHHEHRLKDTGRGSQVRPTGLHGGAHGSWPAGGAETS